MLTRSSITVFFVHAFQIDGNRIHGSSEITDIVSLPDIFVPDNGHIIDRICESVDIFVYSNYL